MRTLSKSDFKLARTCEAKLYFRENRYPDNTTDNAFLQLLARGGYMVEALAKAQRPNGIEMAYGRDHAAAWEATRAELSKESVTLFEATLLAGRCLARVDILEKVGNVVRLLEVKAASIDYAAHQESLRSGGNGALRQTRHADRIISDRREYLEDITYQTLLLEQQLPGVEVHPFLLMVDTSAESARDGVFDLFERIPEGVGRDVRAPCFIGTPADLEQLPLLAEVDVSVEVALLRDEVQSAMVRFASLLDEPRTTFIANYDAGCRDCEFRTDGADRDGFRECWGELADVSPHVLELNNVGRLNAPDGRPLVTALRDAGAASLFDVPLAVLTRKDGTTGPTTDRQLRQIEHTRRNVPWVAPTLSARLSAIAYPIHYIDFEASRVALPYHAGMRPYGLLAFQWSCHTVDAPGAAPRHTEWLNVESGWPSGEFVRTLRECVGSEGTVAVWSPFEESTLRDLRAQLESRGELSAELAAWLDGLPARIVDLHKIAKEEYYHPLMKGRTSIKVVLDALWQTDSRLREQCAEWSGLAFSANADPYKALPPVVIAGEPRAVHDGTGAIEAYEMMLFSETGQDPATRSNWSQLLRQYCELDTLSMVLIHEHWRRICEC
jgi:hypothetical protein